MNRPISPSSTLVRLRGLSLTLTAASGPVEVLREISLDVLEGETISVVGPSGSGKTSLIMVIAGLERATAGEVRVAGHDLTALAEDELARFRRDSVGIVFQDFHLIPTMTALENVAVPLEFAGQRDAFARAEKALEAVGLGRRIGHYPGQLSGGEQQRTALARAFVTEPRLLLADEPTGNLDGETGEHITDLLFDLQARTGTTMMLITHDPALAARCRRRLDLADGRLCRKAEAPA
jgi:putative ABC transport system ATP-binding protein